MSDRHLENGKKKRNKAFEFILDNWHEISEVIFIILIIGGSSALFLYDKTNIPQEIRSSVTRTAMVRTKKWKLVIRNGTKEELYNLIDDPQELYNLIDEYDFLKVKADLKEKLLRWYLNTSDNPHWVKKRYV